MLLRFMHRYLEKAGDDGAAGGDGGGGSGGGDAAAAAAAAAAQGGGDGKGGSSALAGGNQNEWIPEKYRTNRADGTLDIDASARKIAAGYGELDKRMKAVGLPPESHDKYEVKVDDAVKPVVDELLKDPGMGDFLKAAHGEGLTSKQVSFALGWLAKIAPDMVDGGHVVTQEQCQAELGKVWKPGADYDKQLASAFRASSTFAAQLGIQFEDLEKAGLGDNPLFVRIMAAVGAEMGEDTSVAHGGSDVEGKSFEERTSELRAELDKLDLHDVKRKDVQAKIDALYARKYPARKPILQAG